MDLESRNFVELQGVKTNIFNFMSNAESNDRMELVKAIVKMLSTKELKGLKTMTSNRITALNKKDVWSKEGEIEMRKKEFEKKKAEREKLKAQNDEKNKQNEQMEIERGALGYALASSDLPQVDQVDQHEQLVISFDCEFIEVKEAHGYVHLAAEVSIMTLQNGIISNVYQEKVHHQDYRVTNYVHNLTGCDDKMFKNKDFKSLQTVR